MTRLSFCRAVGIATVLIAGLVADAIAEEKHKIYLSMSYIGNDWQAEASNMVKAMATHPDYADRVDLRVQIAGANPERQVQQINAMVESDADAIVIFPISPTALNQAVKNACDQGVTVFAYDSEITEPCVYNVHINQYEAGRAIAQWLVDELGGDGDVVMVTGVPGTSVDELRNKGAKDVFAKYSDINIVAESVGMWSQAVAREELDKILSIRNWDEIDGLWMQVGCYTANAMQLEAGMTAQELKPCAGEGSNGGRIQMLPPGTEVEAGECPYCPLGAPRISYASPPYSGGLALKLAIDVLEGKDVEKDIVLPLPLVTNETIALCEIGSWEEMSNGCNVFQPGFVPNPGWFASIYSPETPELGMEAALVGQPEIVW